VNRAVAQRLFVLTLRASCRCVVRTSLRTSGAWLALAVEVEVNGSAGEFLQGWLVDFFTFADVDGAPDVSFEAGVEEA